MKPGTVLRADTHAPMREGVRSNLLVTVRIIALMDQERRFTKSLKSSVKYQIVETCCLFRFDQSEISLR